MAQLPLSVLIERLQAARQKLLQEMPKIAVEYAETTSNLVIADIQKKGLPGEKYSTTPMYASQSVFNNKAGFKPIGKNEEKALKTSVFDISSKKSKRVAVKKDYTERKSMYLADGYEELRALNGLQTDVVDLTFSGRMLQNIRVQSVKADGLKFVAIVGASQKENKDKLEGQHERYGDILKPSKEILDVSNIIPINRVKAILNETLNINIQ